MPSRYDPKKNCRVGTMNEAQFYAEADAANGAYFRTLLAAWTAAGGTLRWGSGGCGLRGRVGGKEVGACFVAPAFGGKKDRIELSLTGLSKQLGASACQALAGKLAAAAGDQFLGKTMVSIVEPGRLSATARTALTRALVALL